MRQRAGHSFFEVYEGSLMSLSGMHEVGGGASRSLTPLSTIVPMTKHKQPRQKMPEAGEADRCLAGSCQKQGRPIGASPEVARSARAWSAVLCELRARAWELCERWSAVRPANDEILLLLRI